MKLNILISTHNEKIANVPLLLLPERKDVSYVVSFQYTDDSMLALIPEEFKREDIKFAPVQTIGLCKNRNNALLYADGDIALIADDDVKYTNEYIDTIIDTFANNPQTDVALFKIKTRDEDPPMKRYPISKGRYKVVKGYYPSSVEMAFRLSQVKDKVSFDERFGLGSEYLNSGEEEVFIKDCINSSLQVDFFPHYIVEHPYTSTGKKYLTPTSLRSERIAAKYDAQFIRYQELFNKAAEKRENSYYLVDGVHPALAGSQLMARALTPVIESIL